MKRFEGLAVRLAHSTAQHYPADVSPHRSLSHIALSVVRIVSNIPSAASSPHSSAARSATAPQDLEAESSDSSELEGSADEGKDDAGDEYDGQKKAQRAPRFYRFLQGRSVGNMRWYWTLEMNAALERGSFRPFFSSSSPSLTAPWRCCTGMKLIPNIGTRLYDLKKQRLSRNGLLAEYVRRQTGTKLVKLQISRRLVLLTRHADQDKKRTSTFIAAFLCRR